MKKYALVAGVIFGATTMFAQDLTSKKGENYLPEAGEYAFGMDAVPILNYIGNFFGKTTPNDATNIWLPNNTNFALSGKYFLEEDFAFRVGLRVGFGANTSKTTVGDLANPSTTNPWPELPNTVENKMKRGYTAVGINLGVEYRRGSTRLQGYYGGEIGFMIQSSSAKYTYGNDLNPSGTNPVFVSGSDEFFDDLGNSYGNVNNPLFGASDAQGNGINTRTLSEKSGVNFGLGLRAFTGVEYFVLPKLSLGGEIGWGLALNMGGKASAVAETIGHKGTSTSPTVEEITRESKGSTNVGVESSLFNPVFGPVGRLNIIFHF